MRLLYSITRRLAIALLLSLVAYQPCQAFSFFRTPVRKPFIPVLEEQGDLRSTSISDLPSLLTKIRPGMRRSEVEQLNLEPDEGVQPEHSTRYRWGAGFVILVPFDQATGLWEPQNKVNGIPKLVLR